MTRPDGGGPDPALWKRLEPLLDELLDLPAADRASALDRLTGDAPELRPHLERLLAADARAEGLLEAAPEAIAQPLLDHADTEAEGPPAELGPWRVVREVGRGGMGTVYLAERADGQFEQTVAIKILKRGMDTELITRRFLLERQILARLEHPNIARLLDGGVTDDGRPYFVMEYVDGLTLTEFANRERLDVAARLRLCEDVVAAVQYAQQRLVVHRDLKPSNILVTHDGQVKLLDFGIAKLLADDEVDAPTLTRPDHRLVTPEYAAPEQLRGEPVTTATDVHALGVILYELLSGHRPHPARGRTPVQREQAVLDRDAEPLPRAVSRVATRRRPDGTTEAVSPASVAAARSTSPRALRRQLGGDLANIVAMALERDPGRRYPSAAALLDDLRRHRTGQPVLARGASLGYRARKYLERHRLAVTAAALVVLALVAGLVGTAWQARKAARQAARAQEVTSFLTGLFAAADPDALPGEEPTASDLLTLGAARIEDELSGDPETRLELLRLLGQLHVTLGDFDGAVPLLEQALALTVERDGEDGPRTRRALHDLGAAHVEADRLVVGDSLLSRALARWDRDREADDPDLARLLNDVAALEQNRGDIDRSEALYLEAIAVDRRAFGPESAPVATDLDNLGVLYAENGRLEEARALQQQALAIRRAVLPADHSEIGLSLHNLAFVAWKQGDLEEGETRFREAIAFRRGIYPRGHPDLAGSLDELAGLYTQQGRFTEADSLLAEALTMRRRYLGDAHTEVASNLNGIALLAYRRGDYAAAAAGFAEALAVFEQLLPPTHRTLIVVENNTAGSLRRAGDLEGAAARYRSLLERRRRADLRRDPLNGRDLFDAGRTLRLTGHPDEAVAVLRDALATRKADSRVGEVLLAETRQELALALDDAGEGDEAAALLRAAIATYESELAADDPRLASARAALAGR